MYWGDLEIMAKRKEPMAGIKYFISLPQLPIFISELVSTLKFSLMGWPASSPGVLATKRE